MYARWTMQQVLRVLVVVVIAAFVSYVSRKFSTSYPREMSTLRVTSIYNREFLIFFPYLSRKTKSKSIAYSLFINI